MMLRLNIENVPSLASGDPVEIALREHGLVIGRAAHADWTLPDANNHVSSVHCEIDYRDGRYILTDKSTNGTFINGAGERLAKPVQLRDGDLLQIGHYQIRVEEVPDGAAHGAGGGAGAAGGNPFGGGIDWTMGADAAAKAVSTTKFGREAPRALFQSAQDPLMAAFAPPSARPDPFGAPAAVPDPFGIAAPASPSFAAPDPFGVAPAAPPAAFAAPDPFGTATPPPAVSAPDPFGTTAPASASFAAPDPFGVAPAARPAAFAAPDPFGSAAAGAPDPFAPPPPASVPHATTPNTFGVAPAAPPAAFSAPDPFGTAAAPLPPASPPAALASPDPFGSAAAATPDPFAPPPPASVQHATTPDPFGAGAAADPFGMASPPAAPSSGGDPFGSIAAPPPAAPAPAAPAPAPAAGDPWSTLNGAGAVAFTPVAPPAPPPAPPPPPPVAPAPPPVAAVAPAAVPPPPQPAPPPAPDALFERLLAATGLDRRDVGARTPETIVDTIGQLLRQTADGLFKLLEARTRVRHQFGVGAQVTTFQRAGNNPLKWTRSPDQALKQMIGDPGPGFLEGTQAVLGAFEDIQAHEMAMMAAMQEAMQATIKRFAPDTIRSRISAKGWLTSVLPGSREATLWRAYESEFNAFADETEAAYLDLFARHFKKAYERIVSAKE